VLDLGWKHSDWTQMSKVLQRHWSISTTAMPKWDLSQYKVPLLFLLRIWLPVQWQEVWPVYVTAKTMKAHCYWEHHSKAGPRLTLSWCLPKNPTTVTVWLMDLHGSAAYFSWLVQALLGSATGGNAPASSYILILQHCLDLTNFTEEINGQKEKRVSSPRSYIISASASPPPTPQPGIPHETVTHGVNAPLLWELILPWITFKMTAVKIKPSF
jgi:hypothetical protein